MNLIPILLSLIWNGLHFTVGQGRLGIEICRIRYRLNWKPQCFVFVFQSLKFNKFVKLVKNINQWHKLWQGPNPDMRTWYRACCASLLAVPPPTANFCYFGSESFTARHLWIVLKWWNKCLLVLEIAADITCRVSDSRSTLRTECVYQVQIIHCKPGDYLSAWMISGDWYNWTQIQW